MKVLFTSDVPLIKYGMARGFEKIGSSTKICPLWKIEKSEQEQEFMKAVEEFRPDIIFTEGHSGFHQPSFFNVIDNMNLNLFYWAIEDPIHRHWISMPYARHSKFVFTTAQECVAAYESRGISADTLLFACNPEFHKQVEPVNKYNYDIVFVGSNYDVRYDAARMMVLPLVEKEYDIKIWGNWWRDPARPVNIPDKYYGGLLPYENMAEVYSSAKIVLGIHCDGSSRTQTSMRSYEVLGCGAFYLTQYTQAHKQLFEYKEHLVWSKSVEETIQLCDHYLKNEEERKRIAKKGQDLVYQHHTYEQRARKIRQIAEKIL